MYDADAVVHRMYRQVAPPSPRIGRDFPATTRDGRVDRATLGARVVGDKAALARLEAIIHPLVRPTTKFSHAPAARGEVAVLDIPLMFETGADQRCDAVVVVTAPRLQGSAPAPRPGMTRATSSRHAGAADAGRR